MPADHHHASVKQPIFHEPTLPDPIFSEDQTLPSPTGFETAHPSDNATYKEVEDLLKKDVVPVPKSRAGDNELFTLEQAYGSNHGPLVIEKITAAHKIIFHALGDSGAADVRKYRDELRVSDQVSIDCAQSDENNKPSFLFHLGDVVYNFGEARYYFRPVLRRISQLPGAHFCNPRKSRLVRGARHGRGRQAADHVPEEFLLAASDHHAGGRVAASHRHDPAGRVLCPRRTLRADYRLVQQRARGSGRDL
jgi:hypothetical protein